MFTNLDSASISFNVDDISDCYSLLLNALVNAGVETELFGPFNCFQRNNDVRDSLPIPG